MLKCGFNDLYFLYLKYIRLVFFKDSRYYLIRLNTLQKIICGYEKTSLMFFCDKFCYFLSLMRWILRNDGFRLTLLNLKSNSLKGDRKDTFEILFSLDFLERLKNA